MLGFVLHVLTGVLAVAAHYSLMWTLLGGGFAAVPASAIGFLAGAATRFTFSYVKIFAPSHGVHVTLFRFTAAIGMQLIGNMALLAGLLRLGLSVWSSQVTVTVLLTFINYLVYRLWVFR
jgi:putative flippase GtrA